MSAFLNVKLHSCFMANTHLKWYMLHQVCSLYIIIYPPSPDVDVNERIRPSAHNQYSSVRTATIIDQMFSLAWPVIFYTAN